MSRRAVAILAALAVVLAGLTACGGSAPDPKPTTSAAFDPDALELGRIDPTPTDISAALTGQSSRLIASYELGSHLVLPQDLRSDLHKYGIETGTLIDQTELELGLGDIASAMVGAQAGLLTRRVDKNADAWITTALVQFPDAASAEAAVQAAATVLTTPSADGYDANFVAETVPTDAQAVALVAAGDGTNQIYVLRAYGPFLAYGWFYDLNGDLDDQRDYVEEFLNDQDVALQDVEPATIVEDPRVRDLDPSGLWGLTLGADGSGGLTDTAYVSGSHAAQVRQINADGIGRAFSQAGVSRVASNLTTIYATKDAAGAESLRDAFGDQATGLGMVEVDPPAGLAEAVCLEKQDEEIVDLSLWPDFLCFHAFGSYLLESSGVSLEEAQQRISAQALLVHENQQDRKRTSG